MILIIQTSHAWYMFILMDLSCHCRSCLDENEAFLTTADSAVKLCAEATRPVSGWKGFEYKAAFPLLKPPGANFYPPDMDKMVNIGHPFSIKSSN